MEGGGASLHGNFKKIILSVFLLFLVFCSRGQAQVTQYELDRFLLEQDKKVFYFFQSSFPYDVRYDDTLIKIMSSMNKYIPEVYGKKPDIYLAGWVFTSPLGFNAITGYRIIIFDSVLLDTLRFLSEGITVCGGIDNDYVHSLAKSVAELSASHANGDIKPDVNDLDNPFHLPRAPVITLEQKKQSEKLFYEMVASWIAHEASHGFCEHIKEKTQAILMMEAYNRGIYPPEELKKRIEYYINCQFSPQKEREADEKGTLLLLKSGYSIDGFIYWLKFAGWLEELTGVKNKSDRTHPEIEERIKSIIEIKKQYEKIKSFAPFKPLTVSYQYQSKYCHQAVGYPIVSGELNVSLMDYTSRKIKGITKDDLIVS